MNPSPAGSEQQQPVWATAAAVAEGWDHIHGGGAAGGGLTMHYHHHQAATNTAAAAAGKDWDLSWDGSSNQQQQQQLYYQHSAGAHEDHHHHHHHHQHHQQQHGELKPLILPLSSAAGAPMRSYTSPGVMFPSSYGYSHHNSSPLGGYNSSAHGNLQQQQQQHRSGLLMEALNNSNSSGAANNSAAALTLHHHNGLLGGSGIPGLAGIPVAAAAADMSHIHEELRTFEQRRNFFGLMPMEQQLEQQRGGIPNYVKREQEQLYPSHHHSDWLHGRIGLNLGGRTYFSAEDSLVARFGNLKRPRLNGPGTHVPMCQAEGCTADLSKAKHYHRRHKVCEVHSKAPTVVANGQTQRFCQQCSRFHSLGEFDDAKRSCRKRLADHNRRRRKPQPNANPPAAAGAETATKAESDEQDPSGATHSSADTKPTPLLLKSSRSPSASRDDSDGKVSSGKNLQLQQATSGGTRADDKPFVATSHGSLLGSGHHSSVTTSDSGGLLSSAVSIQTSTSPPVLLQHNNQKRNDIPVFNGSNSNQSGPNLSLSSSFGSGSHGMIAVEQNKNQSSQGSIEQPSWLKSATTNTNVAARPLVKSQNFHDLISSEKDAAITDQKMQLLNSGSSAAQVFSPSNRALMPSQYGTRGGFNNTTGGWIGISGSTARDQLGQLQGSPQGILEGHQVLTLLESRPNINSLEHPSVAMEFMQQQPRMESSDDVDDARSQQRQVDIKFHEMQTLRPFYGSTSNLL